jgi:hypothetical protein
MSLRTTAECAHAFGNQATSGGTTWTVVTAVAMRRVYVYRLIITLGSTASTVTLQDTASNALSQAFNMTGNGSITLDTPINFDPWWQTALGLGLQFVASSNSTTVSYDVWYLLAP